MFSVQLLIERANSGSSAGSDASFGGRAAERTAVQMPGRVGNDGVRSVCRVSDLSIAGARLQTYQPLEPQTRVMLTLPGQSPRLARIVWSDEFNAGCAFDKPLDAAVLDDLVEIYGFVPALPEICMFRT